MEKPSKSVLKDHLLAHNRFTKEEYLIDMTTYEYIVDFVRENHEPIYLIPDDEYIQVRKLLREGTTMDCQLRINELVFD